MTILRHILFCLSFWTGLLAAPAWAGAGTTAPWKAFAHVSFRHHAETELGSGEALAQDLDGFLWLGTQTGLVRWDGFRIRRYLSEPEQAGSLPDSYILSLLVDARGRLWVGTSAGGLALYDAARDRFTRIPMGPGGLGHARVSSIADDGNGGVWVGTGAGLGRVDAQGRVHGAASGAPQIPASALPEGGVDVVLRDRAGGLWIGTRKGLFRRTDDRARLAPVPLPGAPGAAEPSINSLLQDSAGRLWIGTRANGAYVIDAPGTAARRVVEQGARPTLQGERVFSIVEKEPGVVWLGTEGGGIVEVDVRQGTTQRLRYQAEVPDSLRNNDAIAMLRERSGQIFVATTGALSQHDPRPQGVVTVRSVGGTANLSVHTLLPRPDGTVWLGVPGGSIDIVDPDAGIVTELRADAGGVLPKGRILAMANAPDGSVYIGTQQGLYQGWAGSGGAGPRMRRVDVPGRRPDAAVWALARHGDILWLGGHDGAWAVRVPPAGPALVVRHEDEALGDSRVTAILPLDDGATWVGTRQGLARLDGDGRRVERVSTDNADRTSAPGGYVSSLMVDRKGRLWVSYFSSGIAILERTDAGGRRWFKRITMAGGLPENGVNVLVQDRAGLVWLSTDVGLASVNPDTFQVRTLGEADGVHVPTYWSGSGALAPDGDVLFGGLTGLSVVRPHRLDAAKTRTNLAATHLMLGGRESGIYPRATAAGEPGTLVVAPADRARGFAVEFAALDFMPAEHRRYAYKLEGFDSAWIDTDSTVRRASYNNLPPGTYRLGLRADAADGTRAALELPVLVLPAWYQQGWVRVLGAIGLLALLAGLVQVRTSLLRRRQRELETIVASRTAQLRATQLQLEGMAYNDALTDLPNRRRFNDELRRLAVLAQGGAPFALLLIDLDRFKSINDTLGHDAGDALLVAAAERLRMAVRGTDCVARLGGDEFAVLLTPGNEAVVGEVAQRIVEAMRAPIAFGPHAMHVSASIGAALSGADHPGVDVLYKEADTALYRSKEAGRDTWRMFSAAPSTSTPNRPAAQAAS